MESIGILVPLCARNQDYKKINDIDFFNYFLVGFYKTISNKHNYRFYIGIDENDDFLIKNIDKIRKRLNIKDKIIIVPKELNKNPYQIWNLLLEEAVIDKENNYFYQVGSDIKHHTNNWDDYFINILKKNKNVGIIGGVDKHFWLERVDRGLNGILENVFFHKIHYEIFNYFIKPSIYQWYFDDMLSECYRLCNSCFICPNFLYQNKNRVGGTNKNNRYKPNMEAKDLWENIAIEENKKIIEYLKIKK